LINSSRNTLPVSIPAQTQLSTVTRFVSHENPFQAPELDNDDPRLKSRINRYALFRFFFCASLIALFLFQLTTTTLVEGYLRTHFFGVPRFLTVVPRAAGLPRFQIHWWQTVANFAIVTASTVVLATFLKSHSVPGRWNKHRKLAVAALMVLASGIGFLEYAHGVESYISYDAWMVMFFLFIVTSWVFTVRCNSYTATFVLAICIATMWGAGSRAARLYWGIYILEPRSIVLVILENYILALGLSLLSCLCIFLLRQRKRWHITK